MASAQHSCTLCEEDSLDAPAASWCPECETFLCVDCDRHHKRNKASKHHSTVSVDAYLNLPDAVKSATNICTEHAKKQDFYCPKHASACCLQCLNDKHSGCGEVKQLAEIVQNIKSSERVTSLESNLDFLKKDYDVILKHMRQKLDSADVDKSEGMSKIKTMRSEVNKYMDIVEQTLVDKLNTECEKIRTETTNVIEKVEDSRRNIEDTQTNLKATVDHATDLQVYTYLESLEEKKECELIKIEKLKKMRELDTVKLEIKIPSALATMFKEIGNFGSVKVTTSTSDLAFATCNTPVVQTVTQIQESVSNPVDISDVHLTSFTELSIPNSICTNPGITGCAILGNDIVLLDMDNKKVYQFTITGKFVKVVCSFPEEPEDICFVEDNKVAVTLPSSKILSFIRLSNGETVNEKKMDGECYGVSCNDRTIVVIVRSNNKTTVVILSIDGNHLRSFDLNTEDYIHAVIEKGQIYLSNWITNKVICCNQSGEVLWEICEENLKHPLGLTVDSNGFTLVACRANDSIILLSPNGTESKVLLSEKDGICNPIAISISSNSRRICVANREDTKFFCFSISTKQQETV